MLNGPGVGSSIARYPMGVERIILSLSLKPRERACMCIGSFSAIPLAAGVE